MFLEFLAKDTDVSGSRRHQAAEHVEGGRFAGPVWTQQAEHLSLLDAEREAAHRNDGPVTLGKAVGLNADRHRNDSIKQGQESSKCPTIEWTAEAMQAPPNLIHSVCG
ncbi:MAG: hypothetical protein AMXMBFR4_23970 [Candidatus Hydrogenedentota bacterium]